MGQSQRKEEEEEKLSSIALLRTCGNNFFSSSRHRRLDLNPRIPHAKRQKGSLFGASWHECLEEVLLNQRSLLVLPRVLLVLETSVLLRASVHRVAPRVPGDVTQNQGQGFAVLRF
eukprot:6479141-Amphidinium_carterae.1